MLFHVSHFTVNNLVNINNGILSAYTHIYTPVRGLVLLVDCSNVARMGLKITLD